MLNLQAGKDIKALTGLRGIAALLVVVTHAEAETGAIPFIRGQSSVDLFFALSGFVISYVYIAGGANFRWRDFALARFARIYPLHILTAVIMVLAVVAFSRLNHTSLPDRVSLVQAARELTLTMSMPIVGAEKMWNFPAWSISVEWWVYFTLFPLLATWGTKISKERSALIFVFLAILLVVGLYLDPTKPTRDWPAFIRALIGFTGGWVAFRFAMAGQWKLPSFVVSLLAIVIFILTLVSVPLTGNDAWCLIPIYPFLIYGLATVPCAASRFLSWKPIDWLGQVSFSVYLIHPIALNFMEAVNSKLFPIEGRFEWIGGALLLTLIMAPASYYFYERPIRDWVRSKDKFIPRSKMPTVP